MLIFSVSFQFFVCHSEEDTLPWEGSRRVNEQTNCVRTAGFEVWTTPSDHLEASQNLSKFDGATNENKSVRYQSVVPLSQYILC